MKILSAFSSKTKASTCPGASEYVEAVVRFSPDGNMFLEHGKVRDRQSEINSYKEACDVNILIRRYENGDQLALLRDNTGAFADLSTMPKNIHEAERLSKNVNALYSSMGDDIKAKYRDVNEFLGAFSTKSNFEEFCGFAHEIVKKRSESYVKKKEDKPDA